VGTNVWAQAEEDAVPGVPFKPGDTITFQEVDKLRGYLPEPFWEWREYFFFEGMTLEIGEFNKDYPNSEDRDLATEKFGGQARIGRDNSLENYTMGQPFPTVDPADPQAGVKHAWNFQYKQDALEGQASFFFTYWDSGEQLPLWFEGTGWGMRLANRPDYMETNGDIFKKEKRMGAGGIEVKGPPDYRGILALGYRYKAIDKPRDENRDTDVWVYIPDLRRVRRISGSRRTDSIAGTDMTPEDQGAFNGVITEFEWEYIGEDEVLAPIDTRLMGYPFSKEENFGPYGFSYGNDVWQLRKVHVLEMTPKEDHIYTRKRIWLDKQTYQPLYGAAYDRRKELWKLIALNHHWSERTDLPIEKKLDGINAFLPSCSVLVNVMTGTGVRVEVFDAHATRRRRGQIRKQIDIGRLSRKGR
jgi:hypothetical protein